MSGAHLSPENPVSLFAALFPAGSTDAPLHVAYLPCRAMMLNVNEPETRGVALALQTMLDDLGKGVVM